jgi:predicted nucleic acid-binding protein
MNSTPNEHQRQKLDEIMAAAFVEVRALARAGERNAEQIADLADALHTLPVDVHDAERWSTNHARGQIEAYQQRWHKTNYLGRRDYLAAFDAAFPEQEP